MLSSFINPKEAENAQNAVREALMDAADLNFVNATSRNEFISNALHKRGYWVAPQRVPFIGEALEFDVAGELVYLP